MRAATAPQSTSLRTAGTTSRVALWPLPRRLTQHARRSDVACLAAQQSTGVAPNQATAVLYPSYSRDPDLQAALDALFADTIDKGLRRVPHADVQHHVDRIVDLGCRLGLNRVHPQWNDGAFWGRLTTLMAGITADNVATLGRLTFNRVQPADIMVQTDQAEAAGVPHGPDQWKGPEAEVLEDPGRGYAVTTHFKLLEADVLGAMKVAALYDTDPEDPEKLWVTFTGFTLEPVRKDADSMARWRGALGAANPDMDAASGRITVTFEPSKRARGCLRYVLLDPEWHLALGTSGSLTCMQRV
ncbi:hypothetical protein HYH02_007367 [Chlamydomonas schloesseri]|uniref:Plastid lipid-associated protein/fibrillin conserved domain-containing protein n=1 Tax=Chlamydomonas schloesseri TaxID=2026947 RepID=A0A835WI04_9CHLO|nr:hypothetical protein HYH02_007367 [Chlamydomonas schloesseri]|eukprot:KAG2447913.1 hypothetical protein HYH02_007367 [Chlamydomonas schloesseri]